MRLLIAMTIAAGLGLAAQTPPDFEYFKTRVQPIFLAKRPGHARCYACHSTGTPFRLQRLSTGATTWNDEESRKNFNASVSMINLGDIEASPLLTFPLAEKGGGNHFHPGGKHWDSKSAPEWRILDDWAHGKKASASN
jgi:hypothetical protein